MAIRGPKPKDPSQLRRKEGFAEWTEVPDVPYDGPRPELPKRRTVMQAGQQVRVALNPLTAGWWQAVSTMPHCTLWTPSDWQFAVTTALVADMAYRGNNAAASELRNREKVMGTTLEFRRDQRIRYVTPGEPTAAPASAGVTQLDRYRREFGDM